MRPPPPCAPPFRLKCSGAPLIRSAAALLMPLLPPPHTLVYAGSAILLARSRFARQVLHPRQEQSSPSHSPHRHSSSRCVCGATSLRPRSSRQLPVTRTSSLPTSLLFRPFPDSSSTSTPHFLRGIAFHRTPSLSPRSLRCASDPLSPLPPWCSLPFVALVDNPPSISLGISSSPASLRLLIAFHVTRCHSPSPGYLLPTSSSFCLSCILHPIPTLCRLS